MVRLIPLLFSFVIATAGKAQTWKTFKDSTILFTAKYPPTWVNKIKEGKRVFFTSPLESEQDNFAENINISVISNPQYGTTIKIRDAVPEVLETLKPAFTDFNLETQRFFKWNNVETCEIIYTGYNKQDESIQVRITQWFCFYKTRLYTATYTAAAANTIYTEPARKILNSVIFTK